jgi:hypothetical protein
VSERKFFQEASAIEFRMDFLSTRPAQLSSLQLEWHRGGSPSLGDLLHRHRLQIPHIQRMCRGIGHDVGFEILTAAVTNAAIFRDTAPCSPQVGWCFGGTYHIHLQGRNQRSKKPACSRRSAWRSFSHQLEWKAIRTLHHKQIKSNLDRPHTHTHTHTTQHGTCKHR